MDKLIYNGRTYVNDSAAVDDMLMSTSAYVGNSLPMVQLAVDTLTAVVQDCALETNLLAAGGLLLAASDSVLMAAQLSEVGLDLYTYGAEVLYYHDDALLGRFRLKAITRTVGYEYRLDCVSDVGLLVSSYHYGGIYAGVTMAELVRDIVGGIVPYTIDATLGSTLLYGWLPKAPRRKNLLFVLFAVGGRIRKTAAGQINIVPYETNTPYTIPVDSFYLGGSVTGGTPASEVNVIEHAYIALPTDETVTLFSGESAAETLLTPQGAVVDGVLVEFSEPMHDLAVENAEILESDANYAVLGRSPQAVLTGKKYSHTQRRITRRTETGAAPNVVTSSECGLVNLLNAELVADRLQAYYSSAKTVRADIVVTTQKAGDAVTFEDPFGNQTTGYIGSLELAMSGIVKGSAELIAGFVPPGSGNYYKNMATLDTDQVWTSPVDGKARIIVISGGQGGYSGAQGAAATDGKTSGNTTSGGTGSITAGYGGEGGAKGQGGAGGRVFIATIPVKKGQAFAAAIGKGGAGGVCTGLDNAAGALGGDTTFGAYSSSNGFSSDVGYAELFGGVVYALQGGEGAADGGKGDGYEGAGNTLTVGGVTYTSGAKGSDDEDSGTNPNGVSWSGTAGGGFGGGPAAGANGEAGKDGHVNYNNGYGYVSPGDGGNGAAATIAGANGARYGCGGQGGCGGGGGGGGGYGRHSRTAGLDIFITPGAGGLGSAGGKGADGVVFVYY